MSTDHKVEMSRQREKTTSDMQLTELLMESAEALEISTQPDSIDELLSGEASTHFPEARNRRRADNPEDDVRRLRAVLSALDRGEAFPENGIESEQTDLLAAFYKQF
jgi:hypothetical protein